MINKDKYQRIICVYDALVDISENATDSLAVDVAGTTPVGVYTPSTITSSSITFKASHDGSTFVPVENGSGGNLSKTVSGGEYIPLDPADFAGIQHLKIICGSSEAADRTFKLALRAF